MHLLQFLQLHLLLWEQYNCWFINRIRNSTLLSNKFCGLKSISPGAVGATQLGANVVGNGQLAPLSGPSELIGSNSSSPAASNITLGTGLMASNSIGLHKL